MTEDTVDTTNETILEMNSLGYSLRKIADATNLHQTTVLNRLTNLNIAVADTRRSFMEDVLTGMNKDQIIWLASQLGSHISVKDYIRSLLTSAYTAAKAKEYYVRTRK